MRPRPHSLPVRRRAGTALRCALSDQERDPDPALRTDLLIALGTTQLQGGERPLLEAARLAVQNSATSFGGIDAVIRRNRINTTLIQEQWPDMLRLAGSLLTGAVKPSNILRVTQGGGRPTRLGRAVAEYGRIAKSLHVLAFVDSDDGYRRQIHTRLNIHESRHALARLIFHGRKGELRQPYREGQEDQESVSV